MSHPIDSIIVDDVAVPKGDVRTHLGKVLLTEDIATDVQGQSLPNCLAIVATEGTGYKLYVYDSTDTTSAHDDDLVLVDSQTDRGPATLRVWLAPSE